jgi:hypothetical protein
MLLLLAYLLLPLAMGSWLLWRGIGLLRSGATWPGVLLLSAGLAGIALVGYWLFLFGSITC